MSERSTVGRPPGGASLRRSGRAQAAVNGKFTPIRGLHGCSDRDTESYEFLGIVADKRTGYSVDCRRSSQGGRKTSSASRLGLPQIVGLTRVAIGAWNRTNLEWPQPGRAEPRLQRGPR